MIFFHPINDRFCYSRLWGQREVVELTEASGQGYLVEARTTVNLSGGS